MKRFIMSNGPSLRRGTTVSRGCDVTAGTDCDFDWLEQRYDYQDILGELIEARLEHTILFRRVHIPAPKLKCPPNAVQKNA